MLFDPFRIHKPRLERLYGTEPFHLTVKLVIYICVFVSVCMQHWWVEGGLDLIHKGNLTCLFLWEPGGLSVLSVRLVQPGWIPNGKMLGYVSFIYGNPFRFSFVVIVCVVFFETDHITSTCFDCAEAVFDESGYSGYSYFMLHLKVKKKEIQVNGIYICQKIGCM